MSRPGNHSLYLPTARSMSQPQSSDMRARRNEAQRGSRKLLAAIQRYQEKRVSV